MRFKKKEQPEKIMFEPIKRDLNKDFMFHNKVIARSWFDYLYNNLVMAMLSYDNEKAKLMQELLRDIKVMSDNHWSKIDFNIPAWTKEKSNTAE